jgi:hypothetical protein
VELTPSQREQIRNAKAAGEPRLSLKLTPEQTREWRTEADRELAGKDENILYYRKLEAASAQQGFLGDLRRAIKSAKRPFVDLASEAGVEPQVLADFSIGEAELSPSQIDRLVDALKLRLMRTIS